VTGKRVTGSPAPLEFCVQTRAWGVGQLRKHTDTRTPNASRAILLQSWVSREAAASEGLLSTSLDSPRGAGKVSPPKAATLGERVPPPRFSQRPLSSQGYPAERASQLPGVLGLCPSFKRKVQIPRASLKKDPTLPEPEVPRGREPH
jgi:hypothetical protein